MTDHAVLHDQKNYHLFRFKILMKLFAKRKSRGAEYFEINIEYNVCGRLHTYQIINLQILNLLIFSNILININLSFASPIRKFLFFIF